MTLTHIEIKFINSKERKKKKKTASYIAILPSHLALRKKEKKKSWKV